jgi:UDP-2,4-diacetamido-2,4,6-trideoxy-beta-L-altropyranose hydrolase
MNILFRADASIMTGSGHVMRCLTLASALRNNGANCDFVCRSQPGQLTDLIQQHGFNVFHLPTTISDQDEDAQTTLSVLHEDYDLLVVDHYQLAADYCTSLRACCRYIMVIDDLANRLHDCDLLLDQNLFALPEQRYNALVPASCQLLLGPRYALLRQEFYHHHAAVEPFHILIGFGGSDEQNLTSMAIAALKQLKQQRITADIVIGTNNPWRTEIEQQVTSMSGVRLHIQCDYIATLMQRARLMLGTGGASHWERCICGLPGLIVTVAENQLETTAHLAKLGACVWLGQAAEMSAQFLAKQLYYYLSQPALLDEISLAASSVVPGKGGTLEVVKAIEILLMEQPQ